MEVYSRESVTVLVRERLEAVRQGVSDGIGVPTFDELVKRLLLSAASLWGAWPRPVINATGVVLHTNLGRAPLSAEATQAVLQAARGYTNLELDLAGGGRGSRQAYLEPILCQLTGAEAALVVNNNASAVLLGLSAVAQPGEVVVSRGEAVEIGGGFRVPDVLKESGASLVEVGTTNRTYVADYERAITSVTTALLKVHTSNFRVMGFTHETTLEELVDLGKRLHVSVLHDLGSGCLLDTAPFGLSHEPTVQESVAAGVDLVFFSGDKLLGGPQAGIIVGKREAVSRLARHPLARAVRIDKLSLAALVATLLHYIKGEVQEKVPVWRMVSMNGGELEARAQAWRAHAGAVAQVAEGLSTIGGGSLPGETLPTRLLVLDGRHLPGGAEGLARRLREADSPVMARIEDDRVLLDPRTVLPEEERALLKSLDAALSE